MISKTIRLYAAVVLLALFLTVLIKPWSMAREQSPFKPLFSVRLDHRFPEPAKSFDEIKKLILENYYSPDITENVLYWAAIRGMLRHISPPENPELSRIWTAEQYSEYLDSLKAVQVSIGIRSSFNPQEGSLTVTDVLPDSPAEPFLKPLDRILRINSQALKGKTIQEVNALLSGEEGEEVTIKVNRDIHIFDVTIVYREFGTKSLEVSRLTDKIALVRIKRFTANLSKTLKTRLNELKEQGFSGLIIDLRNNPGGVFAEALRAAELFLPRKQILLRTMERKSRVQNYVSSNRMPFEFDVAVLVNPKTASSSEILISALQDHQKAVVIGARTYGKGVFEKTFTLENDFRVKFITGAMYSPKGKSWQGKGITPDFLVKQDDKTLHALLKMDTKEQLQKDVALITAYKLLVR